MTREMIPIKPLMDDDRRVGTAYSIGYVQALVERANAGAGADG